MPSQWANLSTRSISRQSRLVEASWERHMIVVTGDAIAKPETFDEVRRLSLEHVHRSRTEPGCISHAVHIDCENPLRFVFVEQWVDGRALMAHFQVPASREFVKALRGMLSEPSTIQIYDAASLQMP
jgi:quinol monooxygenase YgiN